MVALSQFWRLRASAYFTFADYKGIGNVPGLAGRSAIYIVRQLYDIQHGARNGVSVALMQPVVAKLTQDDMIALTAFMASRNP
jgi:cytochrome c553